ncbi:MAG TPA: enediyne biosynthesis protein [Streptosporangiaceae bacterium]|nr:enediyne biosynthesis protein [Streptosporangiaceae bacterium]
MTATIQTADSVPAGAPAAPAEKPRLSKDPRYLALRNFTISITAFNIFGYTLLGWEQPWIWPIFAVLTGYTVEITFELIGAWAERRRPGWEGNGPRGVLAFMMPSHITALACNMLLYANDRWWPVAFAVAVAVGQKHVLRAPIAGRLRHFMNPSNLGISVTLLLFGTWVSISPPYQFTEWANSYFRLMIPFIILTAGTVLNAMLTKKTALIVGWMGGFAIQAFVRHWLYGVQLNTAIGVMTGVAFVLFSNYMITDPATTPSKALPKFMFGASTAAVYGVLMAFNVVYTLFFALSIVCAARGLGWWVAHFMKKRQQRRAGPDGAARPASPTTRESAVTA